MAFCARNALFVRKLSPQVSETVIRDTFCQCDDIDNVTFKSYPGRSMEYYVQIDFKTPKGVTEGSKMSGTPILGVACQVTVIDPGSKDVFREAFVTQQKAVLDLENQVQTDGEPVSTEPQGVQAEYYRRWKLKAEGKRMRTVHIAGLPDDTTETALKELCGKLGPVSEMRLDKDSESKVFALVEFKDIEVANACTGKRNFKVDDRMLCFSQSQTLVDTKTFAEESVHFNAPFMMHDPSVAMVMQTMNRHMNPKLLKAKLAAAEIMNEPVPKEVAEQQAAMDAAAKAAAEPAAPFPGANERKDALDSWEQERKTRKPPPDSLEKRRPRSASRDRRKPQKRDEPRRDAKERDRRRKDGDRRRRGDRDRSRRRRREGDGDGKEGGARAKAAKTAEAALEAALEAKAAEDEDEDEPVDNIDLEDDELAVVPNTELLALSSSYSDSEDLGVMAIDNPEEIRMRARLRLSGVSAAGAAKADGEGGAPEGGPEASPEASPEGSPSASAAARRTWECAKCGEPNRASRDKCNNCGGESPWVTVKSPDGDEIDELSSHCSTPSSPSTPSPKGPADVADVPDSPAAEVPDSPVRSIAASGSARSVGDSPVHSLDDSDAGEEAKGKSVDVDLEVEDSDEEIQLEAARVRGEVADARARILYGGYS